MTRAFVHLHLHTEYSVVDGLIRIKPLINQVRNENMPAVALTDQGNLFGMVKFYRQALANGIKPIIGADVWIEAHGDVHDRSRLLLFCQDLDGYRNLSRLITRSYLEGQAEGVPYIHFDWLQEHHQGLIALSGAQEGDIGKALLAGDMTRARELAQDWQALYPDRFYLELHRTGKPEDEDHIDAAVDLAAEMDLPVVATNNVRFLQRDDFDAHEARVCIHDSRTLADPRRPKNYTAQQYLRSAEEMAELFADLPEALENTLEIAKRCNLELVLGTYFLPDFPVPEGVSLDEHFVELSRQGMEQRLSVLFDREAKDFAEKRQAYDERLQIELDVIIGMGFPGYFLIVADFIAWAKENGIPVGPGRGSGAGSLVAYALKITDLDPLAYELLFERFLNPERVSMPDFDVDFCMDRRDEVIEYVGQRYGKDRVSQIITYGSMAAKAVVRDTGRVLGQPYGFVDQIAKLIPFEIGITLEKALEQEEALRSRYENEEDVQTLIELALKLEGLTRNAGKHAGGVVIAPSPLTDFTALYCEQGATTAVTQFDMSDVEGIGLVKFDFLGLRTLTIIDWAVRDINIAKREKGEPELDISAIPLDDRATYSLVMRADTTAVFQLESPGMKDLIKRLRPDTFADMIALVALFRPGPLQSGMVDDYVDRKHGRQKVEYPHPELEPILKPTYGTILYQEQVMQIAQVLAGYSLGGADLLRRAMGKKKPEEMAKQRAIFTEGAVAHNVDEANATSIFDTMEKFAEYGFNKSHSAAYALVAYQTAWLKAHYPAAFMAAVLSSDMDNTDKVVGLYEECNEMKLVVKPPHVNHSRYPFTVADERTILYGLGAIKGAGEAALEGIVTEREANGPYLDLFDFCRRLDTRKVNKRVLDSLIRSGAMDGLGPHRNAIMTTLPQAIQRAEQQSKNDQQGIIDMFGLSTDVSAEEDSDVHYVDVPDWSEEDRLQGEKETLGLYLTGHPYNRYEQELRNVVTCRIAEVRPGKKYTVAGLLIRMRSINSRRGKMIMMTLDDRTARIEVTVYSEVLQRYSDRLVKDRILVVQGKAEEDSFTGLAITAEHIMDVQQARESKVTGLVIEMQSSNASRQTLKDLHQLLEAHSPGNCPVVIHYQRPEGCAELRLADAWRVRLPDQLLKQLETFAGVDSIRLQY